MANHPRGSHFGGEFTRRLILEDDCPLQLRRTCIEKEKHYDWVYPIKKYVEDGNTKWRAVMELRD